MKFIYRFTIHRLWYYCRVCNFQLSNNNNNNLNTVYYIIVLCYIAEVYLRFITVCLCFWVELCSIGIILCYYTIKHDFLYFIFKFWMRCYYHFIFIPTKTVLRLSKFNWKSEQIIRFDVFYILLFHWKILILFLIRHFQTKNIMINNNNVFVPVLFPLTRERLYTRFDYIHTYHVMAWTSFDQERQKWLFRKPSFQQ